MCFFYTSGFYGTYDTEAYGAHTQEEKNTKKNFSEAQTKQQCAIWHSCWYLNA